MAQRMPRRPTSALSSIHAAIRRPDGFSSESSVGTDCAAPSDDYGDETFYGRRFIYRSRAGDRTLVFSVPRSAGGNPYGRPGADVLKILTREHLAPGPARPTRPGAPGEGRRRAARRSRGAPFVRWAPTEGEYGGGVLAWWRRRCVSRGHAVGHIRSIASRPGLRPGGSFTLEPIVRKSALILLVALAAACGSSGDDSGGDSGDNGGATTSSSTATSSGSGPAAGDPAGTTTTAAGQPAATFPGQPAATPQAGQATTTTTPAGGSATTSPSGGGSATTATTASTPGTGTQPGATTTTAPGSVPGPYPGVNCREVHDPEKGTYYECKG